MKSRKTREWYAFIAEDDNVIDVCYVLECEIRRLGKFLNEHPFCSKMTKRILGLRMKFFGDLISDLHRQLEDSVFG